MKSFSDIYTKTITSPVTCREYKVDVHYHFSPACKGATDGRYGPKIEPDEDAEIIVERVVLSGQPENAVDLSPLIENFELLENEILEHIESQREDLSWPVPVYHLLRLGFSRRV